MPVTHFTAWITTDASYLEGDDCDVTVLADDAISYRLDEDGNEDEPVWGSTGDPLFHALTGVSAIDGDPDEAERQAEAALTVAGWRTVGRWEAVDTGAIITVERADDTETWPLEQVTEYIGASSTGSARKTLSRWDVQAVGRAPGRGGQSLYRPAEVMHARAIRPGQGARTDLKDTE